MFRLAKIAICLLLLLSGQAWAEVAVVFPAQESVVDLTQHGTRVAAQRRNVALEVPGETEGARQVLDLRANGPGPEFNWTVYTVTNGDTADRTFVFAVDDQRFTASGLLQLAPFGPRAAAIIWAGEAASATPVAASGRTAFSFTLKPSTSITFGVEGPAALSGVRVFDEAAFASDETWRALLGNGALVFTTLLALVCLVLAVVRRKRAPAVAAGFAAAAVLWLALESGLLGTVTGLEQAGAFSLLHLRAGVESLFACALALCAWGLIRSGTPRGPAQWVAIVIATLALCTAVVGLALPDAATRLARLLCAAAVITGAWIAFRTAGEPRHALRFVRVFWSAALAWLLFAGIAIANTGERAGFHAVALLGLSALVAILTAVVAVYAIGQRPARPQHDEEDRRSLALSGAQHFVWDWRPENDRLDVSSDLAVALGYAPGQFAGRNGSYEFLRAIHPDDQAAYAEVIDPAEAKPGRMVEHEFRLRDAAGEYHWYALRARAFPGAAEASGRLIGTLTDITRTKSMEDKLITEAVRDPVTGLPSRALYLDRLEREVSKPLGLPVQVLMVGLERFKMLNDGLGHDLGDQLLLVAGQRIAECLSPEETLARVSGSQFAVMFVEMIDGPDARGLADALMGALSQPVNIGQQDVYLSASIGISRSSSDGHSAEELQRQAASALHAALARGPRTILAYDEDMKDERAGRLALESDLRRAIERREIEVYYQPIMHLETRTVAGLEALARWKHPDRGVVPPAEFIAMAEQAGVISEVSEIVLAAAARQMGIWQRVLTRNRPVFVSINVSSDQLSNPTFVDSVANVIQREALQPHALKVEITESVVMRFPERARQLISRLRALGVGVACDDFGTGFSNLASLRDLQFDTLKMDRSFIMSGGLDGRGGVIINSVLSLAHSLGMRVVAEGIEDEYQVQQLIALGCDLGQGYLLGAPMPAREVHGLLAVLPVVDGPAAAPGFGLGHGAVFTAPAPISHFVVDDLDTADPEPLPSIFTVVEETEKPQASRPRPPAKPGKAKPKAKAKPATPARKKAHGPARGKKRR